VTGSALSRSSLLSSLAALPATDRAQLLAQLTPRQAEELVHDWRVWARPAQLLPEGDWDTWLILSGRGWGKTRTGAEAGRWWAKMPIVPRIALVGRTAADVRDVIVEGESGILAIAPKWERPLYEPSKRRLTWPNGAIATTYSADEPDLLRGPQHHFALCDELASWRYLEETWSNLIFGLRLGANPRKVITTTPRPLAILKRLLKDPRCRVTRGSTYDNAANLASTALAEFRAKYEGTRLGRQELGGEVLDDVPGALWQRDAIDALRVREAPALSRVVVAIDPAVTSGEDADETGIVVAARGEDGAFYVLADRTCRMSPDGWARRAVIALDEFAADRIVAEVNNGGEMVEHTLRTVRSSAPYKAVHASRGKRVRAEPIAALYEQGKVHHVGALPELEDQMCSFLPEGNEKSPDRVDALVWALTELSDGAGLGILEFYRAQAEAKAAK
jgi:phage terminase large subunit-like protein